MSAVCDDRGKEAPVSNQKVHALHIYTIRDKEIVGRVVILIVVGIANKNLATSFSAQL